MDLQKVNVEKHCQDLIDAFKMEFNVLDIKQNKEAKSLKNKIDSMNRKLLKGERLIRSVLND